MEQSFVDSVKVVIDNLEGGYYHPQMLKDGRVKDSRYSNSGETMFGIDRKAGGTINDTPAGKKFWAIIDNANASVNWKWNYKGGALGNELKQLAAEIIYPEYQRMSKKYLSPKTKQLVDSDKRLLFNFIYATWNGEGWFKRFAAPINNAVASGTTNLDELTKIAVSTRTQSRNSLIAQGGRKIEGIIDKLKETTVALVTDPIGTAKKKPATVIIGISLITISVTFAIWGIAKIYSAKNSKP